MQTRQGRIKYGFYVNLQQEITDEIGLFSRFSWNDGHSEIGAFTDIDQSVSVGTRLKGKLWGRADDEIGIAGAINMLSSDQSRYLAAGGLGVLVGDGQLNYGLGERDRGLLRPAAHQGADRPADYQLLINPAYNADRGPVHVFAGRLHAPVSEPFPAFRGAQREASRN